MDQKTEFLTASIFNSGSWGGRKTRLLSGKLRSIRNDPWTGRRKAGYILQRVLPGREKIVEDYPFLQKVPWMFPLLWPHRLVKKLFTRGQLKKQWNNRSLLNSASVADHRRMLNEIGLDFRFDQDRDAD